MRISPKWIRTSHARHQVTSRHQLGLRIWFRFSRPLWMKLVTSPSYDVKTRCSLMCWKANNESFLLVLVLALEDLWIILCDHKKMLRHLFLPSRPCIVLGLKLRWRAPPWSPPTLGRPPFWYKLCSHCHIRICILFSSSFPLTNIHLLW
jgi:hypothetical protein